MILRIRDADGNVQEVLAIRGEPGKEGPAGKDGYTPVKGVDYFDGLDGVDGYTPIKGVDYFDGKDGKDGADGEGYVLTDADKEEIADMVSVPQAVLDHIAIVAGNPHGVTAELVKAAPSGYGLGENAANSTAWTGHFRSGFYRSRAYSPNNSTNSTSGTYPLWFGLTCVESGTNQAQIAFLAGSSNGLVEARRYKTGSTLYEWEYVNPPMLEGVEYRTTERCAGKAVYTKLINGGEAYDLTSINLSSTPISVIRYAGYLTKTGAKTIPLPNETESGSAHFAFTPDSDEMDLIFHCDDSRIENYEDPYTMWVQIWYTK